ncbi:helix-hairpin-helix domain-containing protein [Oceanobacillus alkalisoli]|uniref:helix-hairpin-helix domain-containing protein n=1 Tax=Oceanobacillus alkalisoli TaxID=2925113 RepID=UPI001EEF9C46|nr:helix-hairpin-helix domain-containing protein [Oceanobacillus alkalisoli]MCF3941827.1 helix-hairpin-helix domain-containing protein [Oceanobacillus alkalisoli]MCG5103107.1 helix-hairpin-helix domain-containing protein [Oceanobacillus alkalisoli]
MSDGKKKIIFLAGIGLAILLFFIITGKPVKEESNHNNLHAAMENMEETIAPEEDQEASFENVIVDIKGEVKQPGVYEISADSRVNDVIEIAGGFTEEADIQLINLAQKVHDEMSIIVSKQGEEAAANTSSSADAGTDGKVRINYATQDEIESLNGIGPAKAQAIIEYREENGLFQRAEDLLDISGIGEKTLDSFIDQIQVP